MIRWIHNWLAGHRVGEVRDLPVRASTAATVPPRPAQTIDVAHAAMQAQAAHLSQLVRDGVPTMRRRQRRERAKLKVIASLDQKFCGDPQLVDEVTERMVEVAEFDPRIARLID